MNEAVRHPQSIGKQICFLAPRSNDRGPIFKTTTGTRVFK
jgi:hypothetical protein